MEIIMQPGAELHGTLNRKRSMSKRFKVNIPR